MNIQDKAPNFTLPDQNGAKVSLSSFKGQNVVLYFYPKDNTPGCTLEAIRFTALKAKFDALKTVVLGVSADSEKSHCSFAEKHNLGITLLSDPEHAVLEQYGVWQLKKNYGKEYFGIIRSTFLIGPDQRILKIWNKVKVEGHAEEVLDAVAEAGR